MNDVLTKFAKNTKEELEEVISEGLKKRGIEFTHREGLITTFSINRVCEGLRFGMVIGFTKSSPIITVTYKYPFYVRTEALAEVCLEVAQHQHFSINVHSGELSYTVKFLLCGGFNFADFAKCLQIQERDFIYYYPLFFKISNSGRPAKKEESMHKHILTMGLDIYEKEFSNEIEYPTFGYACMEGPYYDDGFFLEAYDEFNRWIDEVLKSKEEKTDDL